MAPRAASRDYDTVIAESPVRHALFNKPFSNFRRRTENLLDTITGGTLPPEVEADRRREQERTRALTCRYCRVTYATDDGLNKHYDLFPVHFTAERQKVVKNQQAESRNEQKPHQRSASQPLTQAMSSTPPVVDGGRRRQQSFAAENVAAEARQSLRQSPVPQMRTSPKPVQQMSNPPKRKPSVPYELREQYVNEPARLSNDRRSSVEGRASFSSRARSTPNLKTSDEIPSSRPQPTVSYSSPDANLDALAPAFHAQLSVRSADTSPPPTMQSQLPYVQPDHAEPPIASMYAMDPRFASDFYLPPRTGPSGYDMAFDTSPSPYGVTNAMTFANNAFSQHHAQNTAVPPRAAAMLPNFDFESNFTNIGRDGVAQPSSAKPVHAMQQADMTYDRQGNINRQAGQRAAARSAQRNVKPGMDGTQANAGSPAYDPRMINSHAGPSRGMSMPTVGNAVRAIIATGASGSGGQAVMPANASGSAFGGADREPVNAYMTLGDDDEDGQSQPIRSRKDSTGGRRWGTLMDALPGSPQDEKRKVATASPKAIEPVKTGLTSFSNDVPPTSPGASSANNSPTTRSRRNTNPFLNRDFMSKVPTALKTPPLSPGSPWRNVPASPGNPFTPLSDEETDEASYFDAVEGAPRTPADEVRIISPSRMAKSGQRMAYEPTMPGGTVVF